MSYEPQAPLLDATRNGRDSVLHFAAGVISIAVFGQAAMVVLALFLFGLAGDAASGSGDFGATPGEAIAFLFSFAAWAWVLSLTLRMVHGRSLFSLLGANVVPDFLRVFAGVAVLYVTLMILPPWTDFAQMQRNSSLALWAGLLPVALVALVIQVSTEELVFRGYIQQYAAARFSHPVFWLALPSVLFGIIHYDASAGENAWWIVFTAILFGMAAADLTARSGSLGPAIALHLANNVSAMLVISLAGDLSGLALFNLPYDMSDEEQIARLIPVEIASLGVTWLAARLALRR